MKDDIVSKLRELLYLKGELSEAETLYVLAQLRKLSEHLSDIESEEYSALLFYCDWALHTKLDRSPVKKILQELGNNWEPGWGSGGNLEFFGFITFRNELIAFLKSLGLPTNIASDQDCWFEFRKNLIQILIDTPLERQDTKIVKFSLLKEPTTLGLPTGDYMYWYRVVFDNGESEEWNVQLADPGPKRRALLDEDAARFFQRFIDKVRYRKEAAEREKHSDPSVSIKSESGN